MIDDLKDARLIEDSTSPYSAPLILVKKKDGKSFRPVIDYRELNKVIKNQIFPKPSIPSILEAAEGRKYFTVIDMKDGFHQIHFTERSKELTAFSSGVRHMQFRVAPMGIKKCTCSVF